MIRIVEVGPRDGLQNERTPVPTPVKLELIAALVKSGLREIEATSFVSPKWGPQLADATELWPMLPPGPTYSALIPNAKGLQRALEVGVGRIAVFTAASDEFTKKNINMTVQESLDVFQDVVTKFRAVRHNGWVRGYVSTVFECPYAGRIDTSRVVEVVERLLEIGVDEVSLGDTIGVAVPSEVTDLGKAIAGIGTQRVSWHFHDTRGTAIANVAAALEQGYHAFDSSAAGLGGCPYAPGAGGNLSTEDLVYFLERSGITTGIDLKGVAAASLPVLRHLGRQPAAKAQLAALAPPLQT